MAVEPFPTREDLMVFVRDVARFEPTPSTSAEYARGALTTFARRAKDLAAADQVDALSSLALVPPPDGEGVVTGRPYTFGEAVQAINAAKAAQASAEDFRRQASAELADAEQAYRVALASEIVRQHDGGAAWTVAQDLARGAKPVAALRHRRDIAAGVLDAAETAAWRHRRRAA